MIFFEPQSRDKSLFPHDPFKALVVPRPIGWIATISAKGELNLAPYSYFNAFSSNPPIVGFSSEGDKDSSTFAMETGEFVWSMATWALRDQMNASAASLPRGENEFVHARLETAPSRLVRPPRVSAAPAAFECRVTEIVKLKDLDGRDSGRRLVLGRVVGVHVDERFVREGRIDSAAMRPIARGGYDEYSVVERVFSMPRPA
ncbi:MAG TPA: flavin reductase family protein [Burkholderiales bacterium]|nr:flavin reductase family protein [Burkholderiales bacterium]